MKKHVIILFIVFIGFQSTTFSQNKTLNKAEQLLKEGLFEKTIELLSSKEQNFTDNAEYYYLKGKAYINKLNVTNNHYIKGSIASKAKQTLLKAIELQPSHIDARIVLSNYYINAPIIAGGSTTKAKEQAIEVIKYDAKRGHILLASIYNIKKEYAKAETEYLKILELDTKETKIYYRLSVVKLNAKDYSEAFNYCSKSIVHFPNYLTAYYLYGKIASISKKNIEQGIKYTNYFIENASNEVTPKKHWAYYRLALLKEEQGKTAESQSALKKALELKPDFKQAKKLLN